MPSSVISYFDYIPEASILRVTFVSGTVYEYLEVPPEVYNEMKDTRSKGIFLNRHVKGRFPFKKVN